MAPVPPEFAGEGILVGRIRSPFTEADVVRRFGGGDFELSYTEPGHKNPTHVHRLVIDGEVRELEIEPFLKSTQARKRRRAEEESQGDGDNMPSWAAALWAEVRAMKRSSQGPRKDPTETTLRLLEHAKNLFGGDQAERGARRDDYREGYLQGLEDAAAKADAPQSVEAAIAGAIPEALQILQSRSAAPLRRLPTNGSGQARAAGAAAVAKRPNPAADAPPAPPLRKPTEESQQAKLQRILTRATAELLRSTQAHKATNGRSGEAEFTADWIERYCPDEIVEQLHNALPSSAVEMVMSMCGPIARAVYGTELDHEHVARVVLALLNPDDEPEQQPLRVVPAAAVATAGDATAGPEDPEDPEDEDPDEDATYPTYAGLGGM
jgi:hypothetical protein